MRLALIFLLITGSLYYFWHHPSYSWMPHAPVRGSLAKVEQDLKTDKNWKVVIITASWCPACKAAMPTFAHLDIGGYVSLYALSVDSNQNAFEQEVKQTGGNIKWTRLNECSGDYCLNLIPMLRSIGIHYPGSLPYVSIFDADGKVYVENIPIEYVDCTIRQKCEVKCSGNSCMVKQL